MDGSRILCLFREYLKSGVVVYQPVVSCHVAFKAREKSGKRRSKSNNWLNILAPSSQVWAELSKTTFAYEFLILTKREMPITDQEQNCTGRKSTIDISCIFSSDVAWVKFPRRADAVFKFKAEYLRSQMALLGWRFATSQLVLRTVLSSDQRHFFPAFDGLSQRFSFGCYLELRILKWAGRSDETSASLDGQCVHWQPDVSQLSESFE